MQQFMLSGMSRDSGSQGDACHTRCGVKISAEGASATRLHAQSHNGRLGAVRDLKNSSFLSLVVSRLGPDLMSIHS